MTHINITMSEGGSGGIEGFIRPSGRDPLLPEMKPTDVSAWRERRGLTLERAAEIYAVDLDLWADCEAGKRPVSELVAAIA